MAGLAILGGAVAQPIAAHFAQKRQHKYIKKYMKNKYQWEVTDLIAAGLNPILGYTKGGPGIGSPGIPSMGGGQAAAIRDALKLEAEIDLLQATADKTRQQTKKVEIEVDEFKPTAGGVARRVFNSESVQKFLKSVIKRGAEIPNWVRENLMNAAQRSFK